MTIFLVLLVPVFCLFFLFFLLIKLLHLLDPPRTFSWYRSRAWAWHRLAGLGGERKDTGTHREGQGGTRRRDRRDQARHRPDTCLLSVLCFFFFFFFCSPSVLLPISLLLNYLSSGRQQGGGEMCENVRIWEQNCLCSHCHSTN